MASDGGDRVFLGSVYAGRSMGNPVVESKMILNGMTAKVWALYDWGAAQQEKRAQELIDEWHYCKRTYESLLEEPGKLLAPARPRRPRRKLECSPASSGSSRITIPAPRWRARWPCTRFGLDPGAPQQPTYYIVWRSIIGLALVLGWSASPRRHDARRTLMGTPQQG